MRRRMMMQSGGGGLIGIEGDGIAFFDLPITNTSILIEIDLTIRYIANTYNSSYACVRTFGSVYTTKDEFINNIGCAYRFASANRVSWWQLTSGGISVPATAILGERYKIEFSYPRFGNMKVYDSNGILIANHNGGRNEKPVTKFMRIMQTKDVIHSIKLGNDYSLIPHIENNEVGMLNDVTGVFHRNENQSGGAFTPIYE